MRQTRYVALLRGVNVGGNARVSMEALRETCQSIGCKDVATYIQSGNVVLSSSLTAGGLRDRLASAIAEQLNVPAAVMIRTHAQLAEVIEANPFTDADTGHLHVAFLSDELDDRAKGAANEISMPPEEFAIRGPDIYLHLPNGMGQSKLPAALLNPRRLGVAATVRNWRTVTKLVEMLAQAKGQPS